ncbi:hypothetical protein B0A55_06417 [Friedmanniomyces simplex]|uniref:Pali-domain-containing protein n=1 Tax=Friedmanniomyces simplex TaxID=329884 RepID=A0A4U0X7T8_9PEZI|nr:hypothetical protein B0A55_06417 [Friedmanniomyces simplex]
MGLLRPATPLALIFFVAFVLLLLSTLSTPIIKAIPLGSYKGWNFGVFGYCKGNNCPTGYKIGYSTGVYTSIPPDEQWSGESRELTSHADGLFPGENNGNGNFELPPSTRHSLSAILIVHPIAAFLTLICFCLACAAHFHSPSHSPRYLLGLLILTIPTLLVTLLAFLVDILLFVPHMQWGGWIVLAATILIIASSVVTCAMRRTLVSRKARKKRIAENADMNGANYYENMHQNRLMADELPKAESPPPMSGSTAVDKQGMAQFAAFEMNRQDTRSGDSGDGTMAAGMTGMNDDRTPLNPMRDPSIRSASTGHGQRPYGPANGEIAPPVPMGRQSMESNGMGGQRRPSRDQAVSARTVEQVVINAVAEPAMDLLVEATVHREVGMVRVNGATMAHREAGSEVRARHRRAGEDGEDTARLRLEWVAEEDPYYGGPRSPTGSNAPMRDEFIAGPIGQAIEMDERTGSPPGPLPPAGVQLHAQIAGPYGLRDSDGDVAGMVGLQQERGGPMRMDSERSEGVRSQTSVYSDHTYVPPRAQWAQAPSGDLHDSGSSKPLSSNAVPSSNVLPLSPTSPHAHFAPQHTRGGSDAYYEDVDPRFAVDPASDVGTDHAGPLPTALTPGTGFVGSSYAGQYQQQQRMPPQPQDPTHLQTPHPTYHSAQDRSNIPSFVSGMSGSGSTDQAHSTPSLEHPGSGNHHHNSLSTPGGDGMSLGPDQNGGNNSSYENLPPGARSPGEGSEASHLTSISQRPINPNWRPGPPGSAYGGPSGGGGMGMGGMGMGMGGPGSTASAAQRRREDVILNANPDFSLPGMGSGRGGGGGFRGRGRGGGGMGSPGGLTPVGRYPTDI